MLAPPAAVPSSWRRCDALLVVADGIGQALQGPANEMQAGKGQCRATAGCPMLAGRALLDLLRSLCCRLVRLVRLLAPSPPTHGTRPLPQRVERKKKRNLLLTMYY